MPNPIINRRLGGSIKYDPLALDYFTRAGITSKAEKLAVNSFVISLRSNTNLWNSFTSGFIYLVSPTSYGASLHNLMSTSFTPSATVAPEYSSTDGWKFNGVDMFVKTGFVPSTHATLNTGVFAYKNRLNAQSSTICGSISAAGQQYRVQARTGANIAASFVYDGTSVTGANTDASGTFVHSIISGPTRFIRRNGVSLVSSAAAIGGTRPTHEMYVGCRNNAGTADNFANCYIVTMAVGTVGLSTTDADTLRTYIDTYNANVIFGGR